MSKEQLKDSKTGSEQVDGSRFQEVEFVLNPHPATDLVRWLNAHQKTMPARRLSDLIRKIKRVQYLESVHKRTLWATGSRMIMSKRGARYQGTFWQTFDYQHWPDQAIRLLEADPVFTEIAHLNFEIKEELNRYSFVPRVHVSALATQVGWLPSSYDPLRRPSQRDIERHMIAALLRLAERGQLDWIAQCEKCGGWFCSRRPGYQKFCTQKCQQAQYKLSPDWKAYRARYMRHYRRVSGTGGK
ncbi:MAG TPA: hypothetical protein VGW33_09355 [Terriglobia bacterium]|nr:hypothetical protein [Terriglobia bacterium]